MNATESSIAHASSPAASNIGRQRTRNSPSLSGLDQQDIDDILTRSLHLDGALRNARVMVTGATGWFGTWILDALVALDRSRSLGLEIVAVSRDPAAFKRKHPLLHGAASIVWLEADVRDALVDVPGPFTHIIHAATDSSTRHGVINPDDLFDTIVLGTRNVLKLAACHPSCKVLFVSSGAVYGPQPAGVAALVEDDRGSIDVLDVANAYAEGKRAAEQLAAIWNATHGVHVNIARCFAFVGPHMPFDSHFAIGNFIRDAVERRVIRVDGDGRPRRAYLYMSDLVVWLLTILVDGRPLRPYNVGSSDSITIAALAKRCAVLLGQGDVSVLGKRHAGHDYVPDITRAAGELGLGVSVPLDDAIQRTALWRTRMGEAVGEQRLAASSSR